MYEEVNQIDKPDLKISGSGSASGGVYNEVKISGSGEIKGDIECNEMKTSGSSKIIGSIKGKTVTTSGASKVSGNVDGEFVKVIGSWDVSGDVSVRELKTSGSTKISGNLKTMEMKVSGTANIGANIHAEEVNISGSVTVGGDCETERFNASGGFRIGGLLNGDEIEIHIGGECRVKEIGGEKIKVEKNIRDFFGIERIIRALFLMGGELTADVIEGDEIYLEATRAKIVRGNNITISEGCVIDTVEYTGVLNILKGGKVNEEKKI